MWWKRTALIAGALCLSGAIAVPEAQAGGGHGHGHRGHPAQFGGHHGGGHFFSGSSFRGGHHGGHGHRRSGRGEHFLYGIGAGLLLYHLVDRTYTRAPAQVVVPVAAPAASAVPAPAQNASVGGACLQAREYQTVVIVGGQEVEGYGTACLQPDGSWLMGPPQPAR